MDCVFRFTQMKAMLQLRQKKKGKKFANETRRKKEVNNINLFYTNNYKILKFINIEKIKLGNVEDK